MEFVMSTERKTRLVKSYAPIVNPLTELLGISKKPENKPVLIYCKVSKKYLQADEFYTKQYRQDTDPRSLNIDDFRSVCKEVWDQQVKNQRAGLGWKSDAELEEEKNKSTLENFI
jgi:hypothetical protein